MKKKTIFHQQHDQLSVFEKYSTFFILIAVILGLLVGSFIPKFGYYINYFKIGKLSLITTLILWMMIFPVMLKIDMKSIKVDFKHYRKSIFINWTVNFIIKPLSMILFIIIFLKYIFNIDPGLANNYLAGAILLSLAPGTAMVFVWSHLVKGNPTYTLVQVLTNDLIVLIFYSPLAMLYLRQSHINIPFFEILFAIIINVILPLLLAYFMRKRILSKHDINYYRQNVLVKFKYWTLSGLLGMIFIIFSVQTPNITKNPLDVLILALPIIVQGIFIFTLTILVSKILKIPHDIGAPSSLIATTNFFELSLAVCTVLFGLSSPALLVSIVGIIVEVPLMLILVKIANIHRHRFHLFNERSIRLDYFHRDQKNIHHEDY